MKFQSSNEEFFKLSAAASEELSNKVPDSREQEFHDLVREIIVCMLIYLALYGLAFVILRALRKTKESDEYVVDYEDAIIDRVCKWLCTFTLATCIGALFLLPCSIIAAEVMRIAPHSYYWKWLNSSLLHGLWNLIFLFSNMSLFVFLPFSHLFLESIGLPGSQRGIKSRVVETSLLLLLIAFCMIGISFVVTSVFDYDNPRRQSFLNIGYYLPFLYSCISFIGVLFLLICTPLGFARLFTIVSNLIMKSTFRNDVTAELYLAELKSNSIRHKIQDLESRINQDTNTIESDITRRRIQVDLESRINEDNSVDLSRRIEQMRFDLAQQEALIVSLKRQSNPLTTYRNLCYPFIMVFLLLLSTFGMSMVVQNTFYVIFGQLPTARLSTDVKKQAGHSKFTFGILQTAIEISLILYFMLASLVGFYTLPGFSRILPKRKSTTMDKIILNCAIFIVFSSAMPVSTKILGLTRFDLLGHFGDLHWLSNVYIIFFYNFGFAIATGLCLFAKFTATVRSELYDRVLILFQNALFQSSSRSTTTSPDAS